MVHHPTSRCNVLKDKIQALIEAGVLTLKSEQKRDNALLNLYPKKRKIEVIHSASKGQKAKDLILLMAKAIGLKPV